MATFKTPDVASILQMLAMFMAEQPEVEKIDAYASSDASHVAVYQDDDGVDVAMCYCDWKLAAGLGASLTMIPAAAVEDMVSDKELSQTVRENLYEVMNILSSLFMDDKSGHLKLTEVFAQGEKEIPSLPDGATTVAFKLTPEPYEAGQIAFVST
ncbi:MAG: hypothetical protein ACRBC3_01100 [Burkholderiaceae bacterium]